MRIHHATAAKARKFRITLSIEENEVVAHNILGDRLASGLQANKVLEEAITKQTGHPAKKAVIKAPPVKAILKSEARAEAKAAKSAVPVAVALSMDFMHENDRIEQTWMITAEDGSKHTFNTITDIDGSEPRGRSLTKVFMLNGEKVTAREIIGRAISGDIEDVTEPGDEVDFREQAEEAGEGEDGDEESDADQRKSGVKEKYKQLYKPTKGRCGDELGEQITAHVNGEDGKVSLTKLRRFAKANDCWVEAYASIPTKSGAWNGGMARMNVANRLRAKVRRAKKDGEVFEIKWV